MFILRSRVLKLLYPVLFAPALLCAPVPPRPIKVAMIEGLSGPFANIGEAVFRNLIRAAGYNRTALHREAHVRGSSSAGRKLS